MNLQLDSFVRDMSHSLRKALAQKLDSVGSWETLAAHIPSNYNHLFSDQFEKRYGTENICYFKRCQSPTTSLLEDWGYENCQIKHLVKALSISGLTNVAQFIFEQCQFSRVDEQPQEDVLSISSGGTNDNALQDPPSKPCIAKENIQRTTNDSCNRTDTRYPEGVFDQEISEFDFDLLRKITGNFDDRDVSKGGRHIGSGGFGNVYLGNFLGRNVAVKLLGGNNEQTLGLFETELKTLCTYKHENLVTLLGFCSKEESLCLVYEYLENGSLEDRLICRHDSPPLSVALRLDIARGTGRGIEFLHEKNITHRDIKSANILLDRNFNAKVGDFATARPLPKPTMETVVIIGTEAYLAPEAHDYIVHKGLDIYSFGVVILELLTGLKVFDEQRSHRNLRVYVQEHCASCASDDDDDDGDDTQKDGTIFDLLDEKTGLVWNPTLVEELYTLSTHCLEKCKKERKDIQFVMTALNSMSLDEDREK